jgi:hypothetical protein
VPALRTSGCRNERLPTTAAEIVAEATDVRLVQTVPAARALKHARQTIRS